VHDVIRPAPTQFLPLSVLGEDHPPPKYNIYVYTYNLAFTRLRFNSREMSSKVWTVEVTHPAETPKGESPVRRNVASRYGLSDTPHPSIRTLYDLTQFSAKRWVDERCFGTRKVVKIHRESQTVTKLVNGVPKAVQKEWMFWELGSFEYRSYKEAAKEGLDLGAGLVKLGLGKGDKVAIYADTSYVRC
jgi:hypothetical protein